MTSTSETIPMHRRKYGARDPKRRAIGWGVVVAVHALVLWALVTGTARRSLEIIRKPMEAAVIQEVIIPPPPPPPPPQPKEVPKPPPKEIVKPRPKIKVPPPFVPPPEVAPPATTAPPIQSVPTPPPAPPVIAPAPPPAPPAPPPPPAPAARQEIGVACPTQVKPEMPRQAIKEGTEGVVKAQATIRDGKVVSVTILSGPRVYHNAVRTAMLQYSCVSSGGGDITATQEFDFKIQ